MIKNFLYSIPDMNQKNYVIQPYYVEDNVYIFVFRSCFRDQDIIFVDIYQDELTEANKIRSGLRLIGDTVLTLPNYSVNFPYGVRCFNIYGFDTKLTPQNVSTQFMLEFENVVESDYDNID